MIKLVVSILYFGLFLAWSASAGSVTMITDLQADTAVAVTGSQSNDLERALGLATIAYSPTNLPGLGTDKVARAAAAYAYSPTNPPPEVVSTNVFTVNGFGGLLSTNNSIVLVASDVGALTAAETTNVVGSYKTRMLWDASNHWYEIDGSVVTEYWVNDSTGWVLTIPDIGFSSAEPIPYPLEDFNDLNLGMPSPYDQVTVSSYYQMGIGFHFFLNDENGVYHWEDANYLNGNETEITLTGVDGAPTAYFVYSTTYTTNVSTYALVSTNQVHGWDAKVDCTGGASTNQTLMSPFILSAFSLLGYGWSWNTDMMTYDVAMPNGVSYQMGQEMYVIGRNQTGTLIPNGRVVCSAGAVGDHAAIRLASYSDPTCARGLIGMVTVDAGIAHGADGQVTTAGDVNDLDTSLFAVSNELWLAESGVYTNVEPATANGKSKVYLGIVLRSHPTQGRILLKPHVYQTPSDVGTLDSEAISNIVNSSHTCQTPIQSSTPSGVATIVWSNAPSVAFLTLTNATTITNDMTPLALNCTSNAEKRCIFNLAGWAATNIVWDSRIEWLGGAAPELTVTGAYHYVFSTVCGQRILGRQLYPTVYAWQPGDMQGAAGAIVNAFGGYNVALLNYTQINNYIMVKHPAPYSKCLVKLQLWASTTGANSTNVQVYAQTGSQGDYVHFNTASNYVATICTGAASRRYEPIIYVDACAPLSRGGASIRLDARRLYPVAASDAGTVNIYFPYWRQANELESKSLQFIR